MEDEQVYLSKEKMDELEAEALELRSVKRKEIAEKLEYAKSLGDLSENAEYQEAREAQAGLEERIATIENILKRAVVVSGHKSDIVDIGSVVTLVKKNDSKKKVYEIVGSEEADISQMKISNRSPLGEAMIGKKKGEEFTFQSPAGEVGYTIIKIA